jgi:tetratricopeptide (TPR) repeat protein
MDVVNDAAAPASPEAAAGTAVDNQHPWLGLDSFSEETRAYFYGREDEVAELARRVQRKLLTILFGQSGLGKTSILRAGIVPRLRPLGYCPVYVRIDYAADSPPPSEQIKAAIFRATQASGHWTQTGVAVEGESLWEFLHHRDDVLRDDSGRTLVPLLIFDQFEEIFTLAQTDDFARRRASEFIADLADLVENRPPKSLEERIERDESAADRFDFARGDYRILIALREDYLAHLEGLKGVMPSVTQNRMRLARMTGAQALEAVVKPGGKLVNEEVAESIVRFTAGGAELRNAEVEPALLSLVCRELNNARIAQGRHEISADVLAVSRDTILAEFYERSLVDQPPGVRQVIEDHLLTESGYRESLAEERLQKLFAAAGAAPGAMSRLVDRRLLRVEERLDVRRVELTHDVLCPVVRASRDVRLEREARDDAERKLAAQRDRERATRQALVRARQIAVGCAVLAVIAIGSAVYGYVASQHAQSAKAEEQRVRLMAEGSRAEAEKLVVYLLEDFYAELEPVGRLDVVQELARSALAYYKELPAELRAPASRRNHALALIRLGGVASAQGRIDEASASIESAATMIEELRAQGDDSDATRLAMAYARVAQGEVLSVQLNFPAAVPKFRAALELLQSMPTQSAESKRAAALEGHAYQRLGLAEYRMPDDPSGQNVRDAKQHLMRAQEIARNMHALDLTNLPASAIYLQAGIRLAQALYFEGMTAETTEVANETMALADRVLQLRPDYRPAILAAASAARTLADIDYNNRGRVAAALHHYQDSRAALERLLALDRSNGAVWINLASVNVQIANALRDLGRMQESIRVWQETIAMSGKFTLTPGAARSFAVWSGNLAAAHQNMGDTVRADAALEQEKKFAALVIAGGNDNPLTAEFGASTEARVMQIAGKHAEARARAQQALDRLHEGRGKSPPPPQLEQALFEVVHQASYALGDYVTTEAAARQRMRILKQQSGDGLSGFQARYFDSVVYAAKAMARQGRQTEALELLKPALDFYRQESLQKSEDLEMRAYKCDVLLAAALADPAMRKAHLTEAAGLFDRMPPEARRWRSYAVVREEIAREMAR